MARRARESRRASTGGSLSRRRISSSWRRPHSCSVATTTPSPGSSARTSGYLDDGVTLAAVRCAAWIVMNLAIRGEIGPANGWLGRAQRLIAAEGECAERGWLLIPSVFQREAAGDLAAAAAVAGEAVSLGERFGDRDLFALAVQAQGYMLLKRSGAGGPRAPRRGMVAVTAEELSPIVTGIVYCGVILACQEVFEARRAREWTRALADWWALQPEMVAFTGRCLVHRAEIMQLDGPGGTRSRRRAVPESGSSRPGIPPPGSRATGRRSCSGFRATSRGPRARTGRRALRVGAAAGLAQLRLAQGRTDAAVSAIRRAEAAATGPLDGRVCSRRSSRSCSPQGTSSPPVVPAAELEEIAAGYESAMLGAVVAHARGSVHLADGRATRGARAVAARAVETWQRSMPRTRSRGPAFSSATRAGCSATRSRPRWSTMPRRAIFERLGATPDSRGSRRRREVDDGSRRASSRSCGSSPPARRTARSPRSLVISEHTVARHLQNIFAKLGVSSRAAATAFAFEHDLV